MSNNSITDQLKQVADNVLTEETLASIEQSFNEAVDGKSEELAQLRVEKALVEQDEEHAIKLEKLLEAIDSDHTKKLHKVIQSIDKNHAQKLISIVEKCKNEVDQDAGVFKESLVDNISNYLDLYVEKAMPIQDVQEAVKNKHAVRILENLRSALSIDHALTSEQVRSAVIDGKRQIDEAQDQTAKLQEENSILKERVKKKNATLALEELTTGLPASKKRHMEKVLAGKSSEFIKENFQYTLDMFEKTEVDKLGVLKEQATEGRKLIDRPVGEQEEVVQESVEEQIAQTNPGGLQDQHLFNNYMGELTKW
jgi:hypothetical protein